MAFIQQQKKSKISNVFKVELGLEIMKEASKGLHHSSCSHMRFGIQELLGLFLEALAQLMKNHTKFKLISWPNHTTLDPHHQRPNTSQTFDLSFQYSNPFFHSHNATGPSPSPHHQGQQMTYFKRPPHHLVLHHPNVDNIVHK